MLLGFIITPLAEILKKFDLVSVKTAITPMETKVALTKDEEVVDVDVTPKTSHLNAVKRIFKYLKGKPKLGLWYPRESPFDLEAFSDSDYGGSNLDRKSTTGGCQFLGQRLISWQCKKQTIVATSTTEAEYVAAANCCGQVLWVQNQLLDYGFNFMNTKIHIDNESTICIMKNPVYHSKTKHIEIRHHFIRDCYEKKLISVEKIHTYLNVADLLTKPFEGPRFNYLVILDIQTENKHPYLAVTLTKKIFRNMKRGFRGAPRPLLPAMLLVATTNPSAGQEHPDVAQSSSNIYKFQYIYIFTTMYNLPPPITAQSFPQLMTRTDSLEKDLKQTKLTMGSAIVKLVKKVKKLEGILKRRNVVLSDSEEEEPEAQGRKSQDDPLVSLVQGLVTPSKTTVNASGEEQVEDISPTTLEAAKTLSRVASQKPKSIDKGRRYKRRKETKGKKEEASLAEAIRLDTLEKEEEAKQVHLDSLLAQRIAKEEELNEQQKQRRAQVQFEAQHYTYEDWDLIRAKIEANAELSKSVLGSGLQGEDFAKKMVELGDNGNCLMKNLSFEEVKEEFDKLVKQVESFAPINFEATKDSLKRFGEELQTKTSKRLKSDEAKDDESTKKTGKRRKQIARKGLHSDKTDEDESEASKDADPISGTNISINPVPVAIKPPSIATYKIIKQGKKSVYQIVRENGTDIVYINFGAMLKDITRDDLTELYRIVMNRYGMNGPEDELEKVLCLNLESLDIYMLTERKYPFICRGIMKIDKLDTRMEMRELHMVRCYAQNITNEFIKSTMSNRHKDWLVQEQTTLGKDFSNT
ncbi:hypothetical protein Tco_0555691 [Tanacetum coccineum]